MTGKEYRLPKSKALLAGAGALSHGMERAVGRHYRQISENPDVYLVRVPFLNISTSETNCYLICDGGECLAVDTGAPTDGGANILNAAIDELGIDRARMSFFLTHLHMDHAGLIDRIAPLQAPICLSLADFNLMSASGDPEYLKITESQVSAEGFDCELVHKSARYGMGIPSFDPKGRDLRFVGEGDVIQVGSTKLEVIDTAGHTPGHLALFHRESGMLFSGDHILFAISPGLGLRLGVADTMGIYLANLQKVCDLGVSKLLHSHGEIRPDWRERVSWLASHHLERVEQAASYIEGHPGTTGADVVKNLTWNVPQAWEDIYPAQKWCIVEGGIIILNHLAAQHRIARETDANGINRYTLL